MNKETIMYVCESCGEESAKWSGRCGNCGQWNTMTEFKKVKTKKADIAYDKDSKPLLISEIESGQFSHMPIGIGEIDRVLGGGIVPGSLILLAGDPGIGKSTILAMISDKLSNALYVSGEESVEQVKLRAQRLGVASKTLKLLSETNANLIKEFIEKEKPEIVIIDSIQTMFDDNYPSTPGSIVQVRECALKFQQVAKKMKIPIVLVGHATKEGSIAGPRTLEHLVDVVLYLEGDRFQETRILRGTKNRFGATDEIGIFKMESQGLKELINPSALLLEERKNSPGSVVTAIMEGSRPILLEIQALTSPTVFGYPRRTASGFDVNRLQLLLAVLTNRAKLPLQNQDVYVNVVGGFSIKEPAADLAVACAIISSLKNKAVPNDICIVGEVGLSGEIRKVPHADKRHKEAKRLGFEKKLAATTIQEAILNIFERG